MICRAQTQMEEAFSEPSLFHAWERVALKHGAPGIDGVSIDDFARDHGAELRRLRAAVLEGRFNPRPLVVFHKEKRPGEFRELTINTVGDRVIARCAADYLVGRYDDTLQPQSYAYRRRKGALKAAFAVQHACRSAAYAVRIDIHEFFDRLDHRMLEAALAGRDVEPAMVRLLMAFARNPRFDGVSVKKPAMGVPQGSPLAPVLSNFYLNPLDEALNREGFRFVRYADDLAIFADNVEQASGALSFVTFELDNVKLQPSMHKSRIYPMDQGFVFLGFMYSRQGRTPCREARDSLREKLGAATYDDEAGSESEQRRQSIIRGWRNYFEAADPEGGAPAPAASESRDDTPAPAAADPEPLRMPGASEDDAAPGETRIEQESPSGSDKPANAPENLLEDAERLRAAGRPGDAAIRLRKLLGDDDDPLPDELRRKAFGKLAGLYEQQGLHGAAAACRRQAGVEKAAEPVAENGPEIVYDTRDVDAWMNMFGSSNGVVYRQFVDRLGRHGFKPASQSLTREYLRDHWQGRHTLAAPIYDCANAVHFGVIDLDVSRSRLAALGAEDLAGMRAALLDDARGLLDMANKAGVQGMLEDSGYKGYHLWFFFHERLGAGLARDFLGELCRVAGPAPEGTHRELFPGSVHKPDDALHCQIKMPLGIHRLTGRRSLFLAPDGLPCAQGVGLLKPSLFNTAGALKNAMSNWRRFSDAAAASDPGARAPGPGAGEGEHSGRSTDFRESRRSRPQAECGRPNQDTAGMAARVFQGCSVLRALKRKAADTRDLNHAERSVIRGILEPLGPEGKSAIHDVLRSCANYDYHMTEKNLGRPGIRPMGCERIREILGGFCQVAGCACRFKPKKGDYPNPLRHIGQVAPAAGPAQAPAPQPAPVDIPAPPPAPVIVSTPGITTPGTPKSLEIQVGAVKITIQMS